MGRGMGVLCVCVCVWVAGEGRRGSSNWPRARSQGGQRLLSKQKPFKGGMKSHPPPPKGDNKRSAQKGSEGLVGLPR